MTTLFNIPQLAPTQPQTRALRLRPYQDQAVQAVHEQFRSVGSSLVVMPTGTGKTILFAHAIDQISHGRALVLAHREELIFQAAEKIGHVTGEQCAIEMADRWSDEYAKSRIVISSIQTQITGRMNRFRPEDFSLLIVDEAHHAVSDSYRRVLAHYRQNPNLKILGVTATPDRQDEEALGQVFESVAFAYEINDAINDGWLCPIRQSIVKVGHLDFSSVRTTAGDLNGADLARVMEDEKALHAIAGPTVDLAKGRKTLVFASSVAHAEMLCEILNRHSQGCAQWVHGGTHKDIRRQMFRDYAKDRFQFMVNVGVLTEGFDDPGIQCVAMGRPTKSRALYCQMVGRATRPLPGIVDGPAEAADRKIAIAASPKQFCEVIDFVGNSGRHKLMTSADILGGNYSDEVIEQANKQIEKATREGMPSDVAGELAKAQAELHERKRREQEKRRHVVAKADYVIRSCDPFDAFDIEPTRERGWHKGRTPSEKQMSFLKNSGVDVQEISFTHASQLIGEVVRRRNEGLCSFKQAKILNKRGVMDTANMTFAEASKRIDAISQQEGWGKKGTEAGNGSRGLATGQARQ